MTHFPVKVDKLLTKLALIEPEYKEKKDLQYAIHENNLASSTKNKNQWPEVRTCRVQNAP